MVPICVTDCHTDGSYGWLLGCSHKESHLSTTCTAVLVMDDDDDDDEVQ